MSFSCCCCIQVSKDVLCHVSCVVCSHICNSACGKAQGDITVFICRGVVDLSLSVLRPVPLVGSLAEKAREILYGIQQYYTYTSAS